MSASWECAPKVARWWIFTGTMQKYLHHSFVYTYTDLEYHVYVFSNPSAAESTSQLVWCAEPQITTDCGGHAGSSASLCDVQLPITPCSVKASRDACTFLRRSTTPAWSLGEKLQKFRLWPFILSVPRVSQAWWNLSAVKTYRKRIYRSTGTWTEHLPANQACYRDMGRYLCVMLFGLQVGDFIL